MKIKKKVARKSKTTRSKAQRLRRKPSPERLEKENRLIHLLFGNEQPDQYILKSIKKELSGYTDKKLNETLLKTEATHTRSSTLTAQEQELIKLHDTLKLQFELIPGPQFYMNIRNHIGDKGWDTIRHAVYEKAGHKCEICGGIGKKHPVECHEVWSYNPDSLIQQLEYFQALCPYCHQVKHIGTSERLGYFDLSMKRFCDVNSVDLQTATQILKATKKQWLIRSKHHWTLNVNHISNYGLDPTSFKIDNRKMEIKKLEWQIQAMNRVIAKKLHDKEDVSQYQKNLDAINLQLLSVKA